jgi:type III restriction enzyme
MEKQFQYEIQPYQEECINGIIGVFGALLQGRPVCAAMVEHYARHGYHFPAQDAKNIDIMMETGTGKTFAFIKTMFELNRKFNCKKFIVLVPTVPVREGTKAHFYDTREYFKQYYANEPEKEIEAFVYESGQISSVRRFIGAQHLSALVMTPSSFDKDKNVLNRPLENEVYAPDLFAANAAPPKSYLDCLKRLNPIVIMDEPHRFAGDAFNRYFDGFNNHYLRFGATFPKKRGGKPSAPDTTVPLSNVAYALDSISSFRQNLVKKIVVYTQGIALNRDTLVKIEKDGNKYKATVNTLTNGIVIPRILDKGDVYNGKGIRNITAKSVVLNDCSIETVDYKLSDDALRAMIRETVNIHFDKERTLFELGIKALTLFFIESDTELYRGESPKIKTIFEEEYKRARECVIAGLAGNPQNEPYLNYLRKDVDARGALLVNKGYFSGDKGNSDEKIKAGVDEILKNKKELLSFDSPTRFIFSIWALQEGWDNPNVFTICKLSNQGSEISKLQQIGRGLRICVDQNLKRLTIKEFGGNQDEFWKVNNLDIVVSSQETGFVEAIQNEILSNSFIVPDTFVKQDMIKALKEKTSFSDNELISLINNIVIGKEMVVFKGLSESGQEIYEKAPDYSAILKGQNIPDEQRKALENLFASDYKNFVQEKSKIMPKKNIAINDKHLAEFKSLWDTVNKNAFFTLENLDGDSEAALIGNIGQEIEELNIDEILLETIRMELDINKIGKDGAITATLKNTVSHKSMVDFLQFARDLSNNAKTPISFVVKVFNALSSDFKNKMLANNPKQALYEMTGIIRKKIADMIKMKIRYDGADGAVLPSVFLSEDAETAYGNNETYLKAGTVGKYQKNIDKPFSLKEKWVFKDVIEYDSIFEVEIIEQDPDVDEIELFGKLPKLKIKTPLGEYNPDFCYAVKSKNGNKLILIVESKGYETETAIPESEKSKIKFAERYFDYLNDYYKSKNANVKIVFKKRINSVQLSKLIKQTIEGGV